MAMSRNTSFRRREFLQRLLAAGALGSAASGWLPAFAQELAQHPQRRRHCILLWMTGGPSQLDTFDMKPGHANGGQFQEISTAVPGIRFCEHLPKLATLSDHLAIVRSLSTREGDHSRGAYLVRTGQRPGGPVRLPSIGSSLCKQLGRPDSELPHYVSVSAPTFLNPAAFSSGFLGPQYAATTVGAMPAEANAADDTPEFARLGLDFLSGNQDRLARRQPLWSTLQDNFLATRQAANVQTQDTVYRRALRLMQSQAAEAFDVTRESDAVRERYGRGVFGQGCLLARRLVEQGVPFVEVALGTSENGGLGWDTHSENFPGVQRLCGELDAGWSALLEDLRDRGLLESTTILWIGEFGRTPEINPNAGRDHYPAAWSCVLGGGGIRGGQVFGKTSDDGREVIENPVTIPDVLATLCAALGVDPHTENTTPIGRPIKIVEGEPIDSLLVS
jgi:hypothetical protein